MASTRRPTYRPAKPAARDTPAATDSAGRDTAADPDGDKPAVITATKGVPEGAAQEKVQASTPKGNTPAKGNTPPKGKAAPKGKTQDKPVRTPWPRLKSLGPAKPGPNNRKTEAKKQGATATDAAGADKTGPDTAGQDNVLAFPEPRGRRIRRNVIVAVCVTAALVAGLIVAAVYSPVLAVQSVSVTGTKLVKPAQVQAALKPLLGMPLPQVRDSEVNSLLKPLVQIKSVTTQAHPPSVLVVQVQERVPVALVKRGKDYMLVDVDGVRLSTTADPASVKLPVIDGGAGTIGKDLFQATAEVLGALPANVLAKLSNASAKSVDAVELKLLDGQTVIWGNAGEKELKARVLEALLKVPADPANPVNTYDVSVPRHPVTR
ncbi:cell division protein FtsQ/DivIB [Arthrobacter globiformis]|uniref:cell division protein FtsQ/DivIB n=1 Tax=Arthrobacter globiformis TaxID=1665 RepID=UPI00278E38E0|nr:cell division protein FtsQ/DivIB [Arthrobacter globiformis]MDQ0617922.1 cell division protein FtsQ [Arthrobacter globiformis]